MSLMYGTLSEQVVFGAKFCGPAELEHGAKTLIARHPATNDDGARVDVFCTAMPARFYRLNVAATATRPAYTVTTGSDVHASRISNITSMIADGMLGFESTTN